MNVDAVPVAERRRAYVRALYRLYHALDREPPVASRARQNLARLRRGFAGSRQEIEAYGVVLSFDPPVKEQEIWLLLGGLFALHPHANTAHGRSMGGAMRQLLDGRGVAVQRRLEQLLSVDRTALPHYLRQATTLLRAGEVGIDYHRLLDDLLVLVQPDSDADAVHAVRLQWARDFHRFDRASRSADPSN